jgi:tRNA(fMet)-specific endonuclease VapC
MLLDSTFLIDFLRNKKNAVEFMAKKENLPLYTTEITVFELFRGAFKGTVETKSHLEKIYSLLSKITILPFNRSSSLKAGMISGSLDKTGEKIGEVDCLIAGIALANGIDLIVTENKNHFLKIKELKVISY